jgi:hypothetical protein
MPKNPAKYLDMKYAQYWFSPVINAAHIWAPRQPSTAQKITEERPNLWASGE